MVEAIIIKIALLPFPHKLTLKNNAAATIHLPSNTRKSMWQNNFLGVY